MDLGSHRFTSGVDEAEATFHDEDGTCIIRKIASRHIKWSSRNVTNHSVLAMMMIKNAFNLA